MVSTAPFVSSPVIESHAHSTSSGGTTITIAVSAGGAGRAIIVFASIGSATTSLPTQTIASTDPGIGAWTSIGSLPTTIGGNLFAIQAWYALTSAAVSAATVTVTSQTIDNAALAYVAVAGANVAGALDQNSTLANGSHIGSSAIDYTTGASHSLTVTINTNTAHTLTLFFSGINNNGSYSNPVAGSTLVESALNAGGIRYARLGVFAATFTAAQTGAQIGSANSDTSPAFSFAFTADSTSSTIALTGNVGGYDQYGKLNYGKAAYSWSAIQPALSASLSVWNNLIGNLAPAVSLHGNLNVVAVGSFIGDLAPQAALGGSLTVVQPFGGNLSPEIVFGPSGLISGPLWAEGAPCPPPMWTPELCPDPGWIPLTAPGNLVYQGSAYGLGGYGANRYGLGTYVPAGPSPWSPAELCNG